MTRGDASPKQTPAHPPAPAEGLAGEAPASPVIQLTTPMLEVPGVGKARAKRLARLDIHQVSHLLRHYPMRYEREAAESTIKRLQVGSIGSARGTLDRCRWVGSPVGRGRGRFEATLRDDTGTLSLTWFNAAYLRERLHPGAFVRVQGKVAVFNDYLQMANPKWEVLASMDEASERGDRLRPVYPATEDLPSPQIERLMAHVLPIVAAQIPDPLPPDLLKHHAMPSLGEAFRMIHLPDEEDEHKSARRRLAYNELLLLQIGIAMKRAYVERKMSAQALPHNAAIDQHIRARFPFPLTDSQAQVIKQIAEDLQKSRPMNRLLQGDVGSGKTVVALYAMLVAVAARKQAALMAPTELLAEQHYQSITRMLEGSSVRVALLTGGQSAAGTLQRKALLRQIAEGEVDLVVGTQALVASSGSGGEGVRFADLAVAVIDEQHRFGVMQRAAFRPGDGAARRDDAGRIITPHHLLMTATPIPRTLSLTIFGDLEVSTIRGLPPGRTPIESRVVGEDKADDVYSYLRKRLARGEQAYVVVPAIDEQGNATAKQLKSVTEHVKHLKDKFLDGFEVAAVHGRLKRESRERIMRRFREGKTHVLVATTVIEVGVDVANATVMVIEHAERFGLAQLHQLRGRVGRGATGRRSLCVFIAEPTTDDAIQRLEAIGSTGDGFKIAERDLEIRGMGEFFGTRQHGLPPLRIARIPEDMDLLKLARRDAIAMIDHDPTLDKPEHSLLKRVLLNQYGIALGIVDVG